MRNRLHKKWVRVMIVVILFFSGIQFIRPGINNPPVTADIILPDSVKQVLRNACYDCHSNETKLSWFDKIAPANWLVAHDAREGRKALNFSEWDKLTKDRQKGILFESLNHIQFRVMPLRRYTFMHPQKIIGETEINLLQTYLNTLMTTPAPDKVGTAAWDEQYNKWINGTTRQNIKASPNGIAFVAGYKNWVAVSSTDRLDDGRLRIIVANDIAIDAIKTNEINPWPDGSVLAKIAWLRLTDSSGITQTGEFKQVAFMIKDKNKYSSTGGWGFAQWEKGTELTPYGKNVLFAVGCINCHKPMKDDDFVFTMPATLKTDPGLENKVICSFVNRQEHTMATLYGNDVATNFARTNTANNYPIGSALTLVTWFQQEDTHWFGANIPGAIKSIEKVRFTDAGTMHASPLYEKFEGNPLIKVEDNQLKNARDRLNFILHLRASVMP